MSVRLVSVVAGISAALGAVVGVGCCYIATNGRSKDRKSVASISVTGKVYTNLHIGMYGRSIGGACKESPGFSSVHVGQAVSITDDTGKTLALTRIDPGTIEVDPRAGHSAEWPDCALKFSASMPSGYPFYKIIVEGYSPRIYSAVELMQPIQLFDQSIG